MVLTAASACTDPIGVTSARSFVPPNRFDVVGSEVDATPLTVSVTSDVGDVPAVLQTSGNHSFTASVSGGSGSYTYRWFWRDCRANATPHCASNYSWTTAYGATFTLDISGWAYLVHVVVEVKDVADGGSSGRNATTWEGPHNPPEGAGGGGEGLKCDLGSLGWAYPFAETTWNGSGFVPTGRNYRRGVCSGAKEFDS